jgi:hypothetical protein
MVTVVDAVNLLKDYSSPDFLRDRGEVAGEGGDRSLRAELDAALTFMVDGFTPDAWRHLPDPLPCWTSR